MTDRSRKGRHARHGGAMLILCAAVTLFMGCSEESTHPPVLQIDLAQLLVSPGDTSSAFTVSNAGGGTLNFTLTAGAPWIRLGQTTGSTATAEEIQVRIDRLLLDGGPYEAPILVDSNGGTAELPVTLLSALAASPHQLAAGTQDTSFAVQLSNLGFGTGVDTVRWAAGGETAWVSLEASEGILIDAPDTVAISIDRSGLGVGEHQARVWFDAGDVGRDTVEVTMAVPNVNAVSGHVCFRGTRVPVAGAAVSLDGRQTQSAADGSFTLSDVAMGALTLTAEAEGFEPFTLDVQLPEDGLELTISLTTNVFAHSVGGTVHNSLGNPLRQAQVGLLNPDGTASELLSVTDSNGRFILTAVPQGSRELRLDHPVYDELIYPLEVGADSDTLDLTLRASVLPPPLPETGPLLLRVDCSTMRVKWERRFEDTLAGYQVERAPTSAGPFVDISGLIPPEAAFFDDPDLELTIYTYRVRSITIDDDLSEPSAPRGAVLQPWSLLDDGTVGSIHKRSDHTAFYSEHDSTMIIYAGIDCAPSQTCAAIRDMWGFNLNTYTWALLDPGLGGPDARSGHAMIHHPGTDRLVVFGGFETDTWYRKTWAYDLDAGTWAILEDGSASPGRRESHTLIYNPRDDTMVLYGGRGDGILNDLWFFHFSTQEWELVWEGPNYGDDEPLKRFDHTALYDEATHRMIVHGGARTTGSYYADTWALDLATLEWERLPACPVVHHGHTAILAEGQMVVTGDFGDQVDGLSWTFDLSTEVWSRLDDGSESTRPIDRRGHSAIYVPGTMGMVVFGGIWISTDDYLNLNDTWTYCPLR